jgi:glycerophosphoryl diester phosphodiesterase
MTCLFELQGHRGARARKPENTLPAIEAALDAGVTSIEVDIHLTRDGVPVVCHDPILDPRIVRRLANHAAERPPVRSLTLAQLRTYCADGNPDPQRFPYQNAELTPVAAVFAQQQGLHPFVIPALADLCTFLDFYAASSGVVVGKTEAQRQRARSVRLDLELKRVPFHPDFIDDGFDGEHPGLLEQSIVDVIRNAHLTERTRVRSFDHRAVRAALTLEPALTGGVLIAETTPIAPEDVVKAAAAAVYCPSFDCVDESLVRRLHDHGIRVLPWTVNHETEWEKLLSWNVDGITTDDPQRLAAFLRDRGVEF